MSEQPSTQRIKLRVELSPNYALHPITGAFATQTPTGQVSLDLYIDRPALPDVIAAEVEAGQLREGSTSVLDGDEPVVSRLRLCGLIMPPDVAQAIAVVLNKSASPAQPFVPGPGAAVVKDTE